MLYFLSFRNYAPNLNFSFYDNIKRKAVVGLLFITCLFNTVYSQNIANKYQKQTIVENVPFKSQWGIKTNAIDWLLTVPNITIEYDLSNSIYNRSTLSLGVKGNWQTYQKYKSPIIYNLLDGRIEYRYYWKTTKRSLQTGEKLALKDRLFSTKRLNPKFWRAYYLGGYANANKYTIKFGKQGLQGTAYGIGISAGFGIPLYNYKDKFIDLEFGGSLGFIMTQYDVFEYDRISDCYPIVSSKSKEMHFSPIPVINDLRVSFVFRFSSIKDKYKQINHKKIEARQERDRLRDSVNVARAEIQKRKVAIKDSTEIAQKREKELQKALKQTQDSLDIMRQDSLKAAQKAEKELKKAEKLVQDSIKKNRENIKQDSLKLEKLPKVKIKQNSETVKDSLTNNQEIKVPDSLKTEQMSREELMNVLKPIQDSLRTDNESIRKDSLKAAQLAEEEIKKAMEEVQDSIAKKQETIQRQDTIKAEQKTQETDKKKTIETLKDKTVLPNDSVIQNKLEAIIFKRKINKGTNAISQVTE